MRFLKEDSKIRKDLEDLTGKVFGELTVLNYDKEKSRQSGTSYWLCKCSCGKTTSVAKKHLINGDIKSCGHTRHQNGLDHTDNFDGMRYRQNKYNTNIEVIKNQKMQPNNTSGVKGVHFNKTRGRWVAGVSVGGKEIRRDFKTKEEAIAYRQELVKKYYLPKIELAKNNGDLKEYLDGYYKDDFSDYKTKLITKWIVEDKLPYADQIFDTSTLGGYYAYNDYLHDPEYIKMITPREYFEHVAEDLNLTFEALVRKIEADRELLDYLMDVILKGKKSFPMTYISKSNGSRQEGLHRMYIAAQLFNWDKSFPVLVID